MVPEAISSWPPSKINTRANEVLGKIATVLDDHNELEVIVEGHTDDVPISNAQFRDNWDLAAGRAASVVQAIQQTGLIDGDRLSAVSKGETAPIGDNTTAAGREENRRIEIEITY